MTESEKPTNHQIQEEKKRIEQYRRTLTEYILTTRFTNETWKTNEEFRKKKNYPAVYGTPQLIAKSIPIDSTLFMLEMNNDTNKIVGIGMLKNHPFYHKFSIYENSNFNRYIYMGRYHISREEMTEEENTIMSVFDILCFTGNTHLKRGANLKQFPLFMLYRCKKKMDLIDFIRNMFKTRYFFEKPKNNIE
jgi:hypothetical protein